MAMVQQPLLCVIHIPKTAGTTIRETLTSILGREKVYWVGHGRSITHWENAAGTAFDDYLVVGGHIGALALEKIQRPKIFMAVIREPVRRAISLFDFITKGPETNHPLREELQGLNLLEAIEKSARFHNEIANRQCALIGGLPTYFAALRSISEREWLVDCQDNIKDLLERVSKKFGWPVASLVTANVNQTRGYFEEYCSDEIIDAVNRINQEDNLLYNAFD